MPRRPSKSPAALSSRKKRSVSTGQPARATTRQFYAQGILKVQHFLQDHLDSSLTLEQLASVANLSPHHFHRVFTAHMGESVKEHIRRLRLERAALKLAHENAQVIMLAFEAGYETHESFSRAFAEHFGMSPVAYRRAARNHDDKALTPPISPRAIGVRAHRTDLPMPEVRIEKHPERHVVFARHFGSYHEVGPAWERVFAFAERHHLFTPHACMFGISYDAPDITPTEHIRYDACITVDKPPLPEGEIGVACIPASTRAVYTHLGSYDGLRGCYDQLYGAWLPQSGCLLANAPDYEIYRNSPYHTPPEKLITDICIPISIQKPRSKKSKK